MTSGRLNEIEQLINIQHVKLYQLKSAIDIALGDQFLDHSKSTIHDYLSMIEEKVTELVNIHTLLVHEIEKEKKE